MIFRSIKNKLFRNSSSDAEHPEDHKDIIEYTEPSNEETAKLKIHTIDRIKYKDTIMKPEWDRNEGLKIPTIIDNTPFYFCIPREVVSEMFDDLF